MSIRQNLREDSVFLLCLHYSDNVDYIKHSDILAERQWLAQRGEMSKHYINHWFYVTLFSSVQSLSRARLFATPWIAACQASLSITNSQSSPKLMSIESVMPSSHLILCHLLLLLPPVPPSIRVFSGCLLRTYQMESILYDLKIKFREIKLKRFSL